MSGAPPWFGEAPSGRAVFAASAVFGYKRSIFAAAAAADGARRSRSGKPLGGGAALSGAGGCRGARAVGGGRPPSAVSGRAADIVG